jgi:hypothetical protein
MYKMHEVLQCLSATQDSMQHVLASSTLSYKTRLVVRNVCYLQEAARAADINIRYAWSARRRAQK